MTFGTNLIGPHLLVGTISRSLTAPVRVIAVGSGTHYGKFRRSYGMVPAPVWEAPETLARPREGDGIRAYSTSKLGTLYWVHELARRAPRGIDAFCFDPGMMPGTGLARDRSAFERFGWKYVLPAMNVLAGVSTPERSGTHLAALATGTAPIPEADLRGGTTSRSIVWSPRPTSPTMRTASANSSSSSTLQRVWDQSRSPTGGRRRPAEQGDRSVCTLGGSEHSDSERQKSTPAAGPNQRARTSRAPTQ